MAAQLCPNCGNPVAPGVRFCPTCGNQLVSTAENAPPLAAYPPSAAQYPPPYPPAQPSNYGPYTAPPPMSGIYPPGPPQQQPSNNNAYIIGGALLIGLVIIALVLVLIRPGQSAGGLPGTTATTTTGVTVTGSWIGQVPQNGGGVAYVQLQQDNSGNVTGTGLACDQNDTTPDLYGQFTVAGTISNGAITLTVSNPQINSFAMHGTATSDQIVLSGTVNGNTLAGTLHQGNRSDFDRACQNL